jgi:hypothetical protein
MTLVESMLCIVLLGLTVSGISALYVSGLQTLEQGDERMLLDSQLRSKMEELIATDFDEVLTLGSGNENVSIRGETHSVSWSATQHDLDGDGTAEPSAMLITISLDGRSLSLVRINPGERVLKVP